MHSDFGTIFQLGYIVSDIRQAVSEWYERVGAGPFYMLEGLSMDRYYYRGEHTPLELSLAFGYWGSIQVELIQPLNSATTLYSEALRQAPGQLNHYATIVDDLDKLLADHKLQDRVIQSGTMPTGLKFVYLDRYMPGGLHLELIERQDGALQAFSGMQALTARWDGKEPLRSMEALGEDLQALQG